jgi:hypothetical protein
VQNDAYGSAMFDARNSRRGSANITPEGLLVSSLNNGGASAKVTPDGADDPQRDSFSSQASHRSSKEDVSLSAAAKYAHSRENTAKLYAVIQEVLANSRDRATISSFWRPFVIDPHGWRRERWDMWCLGLICWVALYTPLQISVFGDYMSLDNLEAWWELFILDCIVDITFIIDIFAQFVSMQINPNGSKYYDFVEVAKEYVFGMSFDTLTGKRKFVTPWFWIDVVSVMPWEAFFLAANSGASGASTADIGGKTRIAKMLKLARILKLLKVLKASRIIKRFTETMKTKYGVFRIYFVFVILLFVVHLIACLFYLIATLAPTEGADAGKAWTISHFSVEVCGYLNGTTIPDTACQYRPCCDNGMTFCEDTDTPDYCGKPSGELYISALYWSTMTLTTIGYGDIAPSNIMEQLFAIIMMIMSATIFSLIVGTMAPWVGRLIEDMVENQDRMDKLDE